MGRKRVMPGAVAAVMALGLALIADRPVAACLCGGDMSLADPDAEVIFSGTAVKVVDPRLPFDPFMSTADLMEWTFVVDAIEKGSAPDRVIVQTERDEGSCGAGFQLGNRYRVVADDFARRLHAGLCQGTAEIRPLSDVPPVEGREQGSWSDLLWPAFLVSSLVTALIVVERSRGRRA